MTTRWKPDTCNCIIDYEGNLLNPFFEQQCRSHNTPQETIVHNRSFSRVIPDTGSDSSPELRQLKADKRAEKRKPQFQKR